MLDETRRYQQLVDEPYDTVIKFLIVDAVEFITVDFP